MRDAETSALETLRSGFLYLSAAMAMLIAVVEFAPAVFTHVSPSVGIMVFFTLLPSIIVAFLYAVFWKIRPGMRQLSEADSRFRVCYTGTTLMLVGFAILALLTLVGLTILMARLVVEAGSPPMRSAVIGALTFFGAFLIGGVIAFTGYVLTFVVGGFKLCGKYRNPLYAVAAILLILGALSASAEPLWLAAASAARLGRVLTAVGYVLTYAALDGTIKKLNAQS